MEHQKDDGLEVWLSENATTILRWVLTVAIVVVLLVGLAYFSLFLGPPLSIDPATLGQAGDYFGGILNPILSFLSVFALLVALVIQTRELKLSREELKVSQEELKLSREEQAKAAGALASQNRAIQKQSFEQTFFAWLSSYQEQLGAIEIIVNTDTGAQRRGRRVLYGWWHDSLSAVALWMSISTDLESKARTAFQAQGKGKAERILRVLPPAEKGRAVSKAMEAWEELYREREFLLDSLFRDLYRLFLWIDSQNSGALSDAQKWLYASIVRGKLSWIELVYLFYNGHTARGAAFKQLAEKYALFDNLTFESDPVISFVKEFPPDSKGYAGSAFSSIGARRALGLPDSTSETLALASADM